MLDIDMKIKVHLIFLVSLFLFFVSVGSSFAVSKPDYSNSRNNRVASPSGQRKEMPEQAKNNLAKSRIESCQAIESAVVTRMTNLVRMAENMIAKFEAISTRVQEYYTTKVVPAGTVVENYDSLVSEVEKKKVDVKSKLDLAKSNSDKFSCENDSPKSLLTQFRVDMQSVKKALHEYRTSIKDLIVAVRTVSGDAEKDNPKTSPTP